jgi:hypothetical protein
VSAEARASTLVSRLSSDRLRLSFGLDGVSSRRILDQSGLALTAEVEPWTHTPQVRRNFDAEIEPWWVEDMLAGAQVSGPELLSQVPAGPGAAAGGAHARGSPHCDAPEGATPLGRAPSNAR